MSTTKKQGSHAKDYLCKPDAPQMACKRLSIVFGFARQEGKGHDRGLDRLRGCHEELSESRNSQSHIGLSSACRYFWLDTDDLNKLRFTDPVSTFLTLSVE